MRASRKAYGSNSFFQSYINIKSTVLIILDPKGKFYPTQSESTATSHAPKPTSKQPHIPQEMGYIYVYPN